MSDPVSNTTRKLRSGNPLAIAALVLYIVGGSITFGGMFVSIRSWFAVGPSGLASGIFLVAGGLALSMAGVFAMRIVQNRWRR